MINVKPLKTIDDYLAPVDVHEELRAPRGGIITSVVGIVAFTVESLLVYAVLKEGMSVVGGIFLHLVVVAVLAIYARIVYTSARENRFALLLLISVATTGPYGAAGLVLSSVLYWLFDRLSSSFKDWYASMFPHVPMSQAEQIYSDIKMGRDESEKLYSVIPFLDVLSFGTETQKRQALSRMAANFHPLFAPVLRKALGDMSNTIRVQAAVAIGKIEQQFTDRQMQLTAVEKLHPGDPIVILALARHYDNYAYTGILDPAREIANRKQALAYYRQYLSYMSDDINVRSDIGRLLMRSQDYKEAAEWLRKCIDLGYNSPAIAQWYAEALFACGRYNELRQFSHHIPLASETQGNSQPALKAAIDLWKGAAA
jgi:tetratricopeptide (TPR) repeat protein